MRLRNRHVGLFLLYAFVNWVIPVEGIRCLEQTNRCQ